MTQSKRTERQVRMAKQGVKPLGKAIGVWRLDAEQSTAFVQALIEPPDRALVRCSD